MSDATALLDAYFNLQKTVHEYFGYKEDWVVIPLVDQREFNWFLKQNENGGGSVVYHEEELTIENVSGGQIYSATIYTQRFLPKWVYRTDEFTMICMDTHTDGNKYIGIFDNSKEVELTPELIAAYGQWDWY